jgi:cobaltochelatase CobS
MSGTNEDRIACRLCGKAVHVIQKHLEDEHAEVSLEEYQRKFPGAPILSEVAKKKIEEYNQSKAARVAAAAQPAATSTVAMAGAAPAATVHALHTITQKAFHELFEVGTSKEAMSSKGTPIPVNVMSKHGFEDYVPPLDANHVYEIETLKNAVMAKELNMNLYGWGHKGCGKTTTLEQIAARTNHPMIRVQHTINMEESHVLGFWAVKDGETVFMPGPLALAMRNGWIYLADEYDVAQPAVLAVYQPVMEGKSLVIKEAQGTPWAIVKPHANFRFWATGNTNGSGDETGLYQGTQIQNSANYDRFGVVLQFKYMKAELETAAVSKQAGIAKADAEKLVDFANKVREAYDGNKISDTVSTRTLVNAAKLGMRKGSWRAGLALAFMNKLSKVDREAVDGVAQRIFS